MLKNATEIISNHNNNNNNSAALGFKRIIPIERLPLVGEVSANFSGIISKTYILAGAKKSPKQRNNIYIYIHIQFITRTRTTDLL
jgi:hypothetical protein